MIDLTQLPAPAVIEELDFETIYANKLARFQSLYPDYSAALESDPVVKLLELAAYDEMMLRARINDAAKATMLAYATGADLDNRAADYGVTRLLITPADPDATPPVDAEWEDDDRLRYRAQMAMEGITVAGSRGAYLFHALSASANVADAFIDSRGFGPLRVDSPAPGEIHVWLLDVRADGVPDQDLLDAVAASLSAEDVRPLNDTVTPKAGKPVTFGIHAQLEFTEGGEALSGGLSGAQERVEALLASARKLGTGHAASGLPTSALITAIRVPGVHDVTLLSPLTTIAGGVGEFPLCTVITLDKKVPLN
ncbi:hypothetical protein ACG97_01165 [Vogesella sp. EB]|uniref:baseplate assembly protein n=1 Tax=Vogesella sp. EB TaxID=1526735 RepID=UPI00064CFEFC|nr:baseplate J/gp47 family protein [Vogesella sp. EB]KMJ54906.1 hypothetical protein ACG97_01165 [Vogesella sp. EB]